MCSIERTITINTIGLSQEPETSMGIGLHLFKTPADYRIRESDFMQYPEIENRDDYYSFDEPLIHVWDQTGKQIIYDVVEDRMEMLEKELLTVASFYIQKDILHVNKVRHTVKHVRVHIYCTCTCRYCTCICIIIILAK